MHNHNIIHNLWPIKYIFQGFYSPSVACEDAPPPPVCPGSSRVPELETGPLSPPGEHASPPGHDPERSSPQETAAPRAGCQTSSASSRD